MDWEIVTQDFREALYKEVWAEPMTTVAKRYGMSDVGLRKHCQRLGIPTPNSGYWAKVRAGQKVLKPELPRVTGGVKRFVHQYAIKYKADIETLSDAELMADEALHLLSDETKTLICDKCSQIKVDNQLRNPYPLIVRHKEEISYRAKRDKALKRQGGRQRHANVENEYRSNQATLPIDVSEPNMGRVYKILDVLIKTIDDLEGQTRVEMESGKDRGYFIIMQSVFYFEVKEQAKKGRPASRENIPPLILQITATTWFRDGVSQEMLYQENGDEPLEMQLGKILYDMFVIADRFQAGDEWELREDKKACEEAERQHILEKMRKGELEEIKLLEQAASDWDKAQRIRRFADQVDKQIAIITSEEGTS